MARPIVIAGGGTGGHVYPALAIADALVADGIAKSDVLFVGSKRGIEGNVVPSYGYKIELLPGRGIKRSLSKDNFGAILGLLVAVVRAKWLLWRIKPRSVVSVGGYAAAPCAIAAVVLRIPLILAESNAVPGATNRLVARFAKASAVSYPGTALPRAIVTGNPVRAEIQAVDRSADARRAAKQALGVDTDKQLVAIFGGSLGARSINRAAAELFSLAHDFNIYQVVGSRDWTPDMAGSTRVEYESRMEVLYAAADIVVCRSGATTSAEIAVVGVPSILVPLPNAPGDHQTANAKALQSAGAAELLADAECTGVTLAALLTPLLADVSRLAAMSAAAKTLGHPDAAAQVATIVLTHASAET